MKFTIVTPSFRSSDWLRLCVASVADQAGTTWEHIVQDAGSDDGTLDWLPKDPRVIARVERDDGMYDAVSRGFRQARGELLVYLNADEQLLPGALERVAAFFDGHPAVAVALGDTVVVDADGGYLCHRKSLVPVPTHFWHRFPIMSCGLFIRRQVAADGGLYPDPRWRALGDWFWVLEMLRHGLPMAVLGAFTSVFTETGKNLGLTPQARSESLQKRAMMPRWIRAARPLIVAHHRWRCLAHGHYCQPPFEYSIYTRASPDRRVSFRVDHPTARWRRPRVGR